MRKGCEISAQAHKSAMQFVTPDMNEQSLEAYYLYKFAEHGSRFPAYTPIVAGGEHACILHYVENDQILKDGDLVLVDAGGEYQYYASDITRTYPVNGKFSAEQLAIYNIVLQAQQEAIAAMKAGNHIMQPQDISERVITEGLIDLGLLTGSAEDLIAEGAHKKFYMHKVGHWIGLDTHDVGAYSDGSNFTQYEPGMVQTIEPGIYISSKSDVDDKWKGIGVRIEDNILVTVDGNENLTASAPVDPEEIEAVMAG
jgi:Xaa-Pro aminopeptidase